MGIIPREPPLDLYSVLFQDLKIAFPGKPMAEFFATREFVKLVMQPWVYGSTMREQTTQSKNPDLIKMLEALPKVEGLRISKSGRLNLAREMERIVRRRLPQTAKLKNWLRAVAVKLWKDGTVSAKWRTPSGWPVHHAPMKPKSVKTLDFSTQFAGRRRMRITEDWMPSEDDFRKGLAPHFVHSLDAAHLAMTIREAYKWGVHSFSAVHDCFGTHAGNVETLRNVLRAVFAGPEFADGAQAMLDHLAKLSGKKRLPPGKLDLREVLNSDYFFD